MNIPARYCTGYLGDIGVPADADPMDFSGLVRGLISAARWHTFDARHNTPRIGRILMAAAATPPTCALSTSFGPSRLAGFKVITDELPAEAEPRALQRHRPMLRIAAAAG